MCARVLLGRLSICALILITAKRSDTWALERADIDCKAHVQSKNWSDRFRLRHRVDPDYIACMYQQGFVEEQRAAQ